MIDDATPLDDARLSCARDTAVNADAESSDIERASESRDGATAHTQAPAGPVLVASPPEPTPEQVIEALLFASDAPLSAPRLAELLGAGNAADVRRRIEALNDRYAQTGAAFRIEEIARGYQMLTLPVFRPWLGRLNHERAQSRLSDAALETLSIVAYKQPIIRSDIESIRGVACGEVLGRLKEMGLIKIAGRAEIVGRPLLYGTTRKFLDVFGLADLDDLPPMEALSLRRRAEQPETLDPPPAQHAAAGA